MEINVVQYEESYSDEWNSFLKLSKGSTFLFHRNFMGYHSDRFTDHSLLVYIDQHLSAILPANIQEGSVIFSHQGLSYGGFVFHEAITMEHVMEIVSEVLKYLNGIKIQKFFYKSLPKFYSRVGSDEMDYLHFILESKMYRRDIASVVNMKGKIEFHKRRIRGARKAKKNGVEINYDDDLTSFWNEILEPNLKERFNVKPVHTLDEITLLQNEFPENIHQCNAYIEGEIVAGVTIFESAYVAHAQYISGSELGRKSGALDLLVSELLLQRYQNVDYFDFGICNENAGKKINRGLLNWKEGWGARPFVHEFYEIDVSNYQKLASVLI
jgi:hypothetical protein